LSGCGNWSFFMWENIG